MRGLIIVIAALLLAGCSTEPPHWSPYTRPRSEAWHTGKMMIANYDMDGDGTVTREELEAGLRQYFRQADTNHDGHLDADEAAAANQRRIALDQSAAIPLIDWNKDGIIDFDEFAAGVRSEFKRLDLNGDGKVTIDEFRMAPN